MTESRHQATLGASRRTVVKGAAWAAPVVALGSAAPAVAASLPPCVQSMTGIAQAAWSVGASFSGCSRNTHFDVSVRVTVTPCDATTVNLRVYDLGQENSGSGRRSRLWWSYISNTQTNNSTYLFIEKSVPAPALGDTVSVSFAVQGDNVRRQTTALAQASNSVGTITACCSNENDGIHVNPCYFQGQQTTNRVARIAYRYDNTGPWTWGGYINATRPA